MQTRDYRAPEILIDENDYDFGIDIWSAGCVLAELMAVSDVYSKEIAREPDKD